MWLKPGTSTRKAFRIQGRLNLRFLTGQIFDHGSQILVRTSGCSIYDACHGLIPIQDHIKVIRKEELRSDILRALYLAGSVLHTPSWEMTGSLSIRSGTGRK